MGVLAACYAGSELLERRQHLSAIHAEALRATRLFAWGTGMQGQLGVGTELMAQPLPREVVELKDSRLVGIVAANDLSAAIDDHGKIYTWGKTKGMMAQDHSGFTSNLLAPTPITFKGTENEVFVQVACGRTHMGAVTKDGKLYMWGSNDMGKLGIPMKKSDPHNIRDYHPTNYSDKASFCRVTGILETKKIVQIACGFHHTLCLTADGELFVWGGGKEGALGLGDWANHDTPMQVPTNLVTR